MNNLKTILTKLKTIADNNKYKYTVIISGTFDYIYIEFTKIIDYLTADDTNGANFIIEAIRQMKLSCDDWSMDMDDKELSFGVEIKTDHLILEKPENE